MRQLNFEKAKEFEKLHETVVSLILFIKPLGSNLHRVFTIPKGEPKKVEELKQALSDLCTRKINKVWFFDLRKEQDEEDIYTIIQSMGFSPIKVELDNDPEVSN
ncbi:MAG: hypothetical protein KBA90_14325 [Chitinophagaceae bacterium]|nr:hypothetical protein [Chitinophagaceae bacterium]